MRHKPREWGLRVLVLMAVLLLTGCMQAQRVAPDVVILSEPQAAMQHVNAGSSVWLGQGRRYSRSLGGAFVPYYPYPLSFWSTPRYGFAYGWSWGVPYAGWPGPYFLSDRWRYYPWYGWSPLAHTPWPGAWPATALHDPRRVYEPPFQLEPSVSPVAYARPIYPSGLGQPFTHPSASALRSSPGAVSTRQREDFRSYRRPAGQSLNPDVFRRPRVSNPAAVSATDVRSAGRNKPGLSRTTGSAYRMPSTSSRTTPSRPSTSRSVPGGKASGNVRKPRSAPRVKSIPDR